MSILLHGHHANETKCPLSFDMDTSARVEEIETIKPENERPLRLLLLREVEPSELPTKWWEALAKWREADAKLQKAYTNVGSQSQWWETDAKWQKAYAKWGKANAKWQKTDAKLDWSAWHKTHCGGVKAGVCKWTAAHPSIF